MPPKKDITTKKSVINTDPKAKKTVKKDDIVKSVKNDNKDSVSDIKSLYEDKDYVFIVQILRKKYGATQSNNDGIQIYTSIDLVKDAIAQIFKGKEDTKKKTKKDIDNIWKEICKDISNGQEFKKKHKDLGEDICGDYMEDYNEDADIDEDGYGGYVSEMYWIQVIVTIKPLNPSKIQIEEREFVKGDF